MLPVLWAGAALAAVFFTGCGRKVEEPPSAPRSENPKNSPPSSRREETQAPNVAPQSGTNSPPDGFPAKKLSASELKSMAEELGKCLKIQRRYGFSCPPPGELPPGCACAETDLPVEFNPQAPQKIRSSPLRDQGKDALPNI